MKPTNYFVILALIGGLFSCSPKGQIETTQANAASALDGGARSKTMHHVDFSQVLIHDAFWSPKLENNAKNTIPVCIDQIENKTGRIRNFENAAAHKGKHSGIYFDDSDVYKAVEGFAYSLINNPDPVLEAKADEWIDKFAAAQEEDGYINTFFSLEGIEDRWNEMGLHEMYCAGHLIEAGVAYYKATGKRKLLDVGQRMADHMMTLFGPDKHDWVPGHQEIELALVKLYEVTGEKKYLDFAYWLIEERGHGHGRDAVKENEPWETDYFLDTKPVRDLEVISGHAVRAMYMFCGMCDVTSYMPQTGYMKALDNLWNDVVGTRMYITGAIGNTMDNEGFTVPYDLPNYTAYCETCASIGMAFWNQRMNEWKGDSKYVDIVERVLYNGILSGINTDGTKFFYVNPLASHGDHHRKAWYGCACCPSNVCRFIPSIGNYIYCTSNNALWVNLYIGNEAKFKVGESDVDVSMATSYPWNGDVTLTFNNVYKGEVRLRIPGWCKSFGLAKNGETIKKYTMDNGYAVVSGKWAKGDKINLTMDMPVEVVEADSHVEEDRGLRAIQRGPIVYCAEQVDNSSNFDKLSVNGNMNWEVVELPIMGGIRALDSECNGQRIRLIPYYSWDNREACEMKVWLPLAE